MLLLINDMERQWRRTSSTTSTTYYDNIDILRQHGETPIIAHWHLTTKCLHTSISLQKQELQYTWKRKFSNIWSFWINPVCTKKFILFCAMLQRFHQGNMKPQTRISLQQISANQGPDSWFVLEANIKVESKLNNDNSKSCLNLHKPWIPARFKVTRISPFTTTEHYLNITRGGYLPPIWPGIWPRILPDFRVIFE